MSGPAYWLTRRSPVPVPGYGSSKAAMSATSSSVRLPDRYRVTRRIAGGGMATVYACEDQLLGRLVAVKVLAPQLAADPDARARFQREARAVARVSDHPNVVTIYDIGEHEGLAFITMEYFPGGTVRDRLRSEAPIPMPAVIRWLDEAAAALDHAHRAGIVHRDVKPANLLLDANGRLAVGDFGIARMATDSAMTSTGMVLGTAAYLSPEQAVGGAATAASDRYALRSDEAAAALDHAHRAGIVHRDVKPANLLLDANGRLAVGDFGIARMATDSAMTSTGMVLGTAAYLSPEQAVGGAATAASDRYAL